MLLTIVRWDHQEKVVSKGWNENGKEKKRTGVANLDVLHLNLDIFCFIQICKK